MWIVAQSPPRENAYTLAPYFGGTILGLMWGLPSVGS